jgi:hypothetical protein
MSYLTDLANWVSELNRGFAFLIALPFVVGAAGFIPMLVEWLHSRIWHKNKPLA